jgi:pimeloyl-ACP methyl ester carboxylesterase
MTADVVAIWSALFASAPDRVPTLLVGHSMGGALAVRAAATKAIAGLDGVVVIDVVEGTAMGERLGVGGVGVWGLVVCFGGAALWRSGCGTMHAHGCTFS